MSQQPRASPVNKAGIVRRFITYKLADKVMDCGKITVKLFICGRIIENKAVVSAGSVIFLKSALGSAIKKIGVDFANIL